MMRLPLTISLLASSRVNTLKRCLDSLKPLLLKVPAELIVVFTGTDERVRETAARYTDQIVPFTWCNDFAAARNAGLQRAKGEWFMYIDDDEWFEDVTDICDFFLSGAYRNYGYAYYLVRNYENWDGVRYTDSKAYRLAKRVPELTFADAIHEGLAPLEGAGKAFSCFAHHYGYVTDTGKKGMGKSSRNIPMLLEDIERNPDYGKNYIQLIQEYLAVKELDKAEEFCRRARVVCQNGPGTIFRGKLQVFLLDILYEKGCCQQALEEAEYILENENPCMMVRLIFHGFLIALYAREKAYGKVVSCGMEFERMLAYLDAGSMTKEERGDYLTEDMVKIPGRLYPGRMNCVQACLELGNYRKAEYFLNLLPWEQEYLFWQFYPQLDEWKEKYGEGFLKLLAGLRAESPYLLYQKLLFHEEQEIFRLCLEQIDHPYLQKQLVEKALVEQRDFSVLLKRMDLDSWKACIGDIIEHAPLKRNSVFWQARERLFHKHARQGLWMKKLLLEKELVRGFLGEEELIRALREYAVCLREFYRNQYQEWMFARESRYLLPPECRQALVLLEALENMEQGRMAEASRLFRTVPGFAPGLTGVIREIQRLLTK